MFKTGKLIVELLESIITILIALAACLEYSHFGKVLLKSFKRMPTTLTETLEPG
jgi:hypothetical protein